MSLESIKNLGIKPAAKSVKLDFLLILLSGPVTARTVQQGTTTTLKQPLNAKLVGKESTAGREVRPRKIRVKTVLQDITSPQRGHLIKVSSALLARLGSTLLRLAEAA